eukprot:1176431-Prorocentrum_minimum.AAC.10
MPTVKGHPNSDLPIPHQVPSNIKYQISRSQSGNTLIGRGTQAPAQHRATFLLAPIAGVAIGADHVGGRRALAAFGACATIEGVVQYAAAGQVTAGPDGYRRTASGLAI